METVEEEFYVDDRDFTFIKTKDGKVLRWFGEGRTKDTGHVTVDCMWHKISKDQAAEYAEIKNKETELLRR